MKLRTMSIVASSAILGLALFTGCGSDSTPPPSSGINGVAVKGYLSGSTVQIDLNGDGNYTANEITTTNASGRYSFAGVPATAIFPRLFVSGGLETDTGLAYTGVLKAQYEAGDTNIVLSPITTLIATLVEQGTPVATAKTKVATGLGLSESKLKLDPVSVAETDVNVTKASLKVGRVAELAVSGGYAAAMQNLANSLANNNNLSTAIETVGGNRATTLAALIDDANITAANIGKVEAATKVATKILDTNSTASVNINNLVSIITNLNAETNATTVVDYNQLGISLASVDTNSSSIDINATVSSIKGSVITNEAAYEDEQEAAAATAAVDAAKAIDKLQLVNNAVTIGGKTVTLASTGSFGTIAQAVVAEGDIDSLYSVSFALANVVGADGKAYNSLEDGDDKNVTLGLQINDSSKKLLAIVKNVRLQRVDTDSNASNYNGNYVISVTADTKLDAYAQRSTGQKLVVQNIEVPTDSITSSNGQVTASIGKIVDALSANSTYKDSINDIKANFTRYGSYDVATYISGLDGVVNTQLALKSDIYNGFSDYNTSIANAFVGSAYKMSGKVTIGTAPTPDTTAPVAPTIVDVNATSLVVTAEIGSTITIKNGTTTIATATATSASQTVTFNSPLTANATLSVTATDAAGNVSAVATKAFTYTAPVTPITLSADLFNNRKIVLSGQDDTITLNLYSDGNFTEHSAQDNATSPGIWSIISNKLRLAFNGDSDYVEATFTVAPAAGTTVSIYDFVASESTHPTFNVQVVSVGTADARTSGGTCQNVNPLTGECED